MSWLEKILTVRIDLTTAMPGTVIFKSDLPLHSLKLIPEFYFQTR
jgi:hypothetical protein